VLSTDQAWSSLGAESRLALRRHSIRRGPTEVGLCSGQDWWGPAWKMMLPSASRPYVLRASGDAVLEEMPPFPVQRSLAEP
jgi:hypothetical protein